MNSSEIVNPKSIAYFSMEIGVKSEAPTYSGGLGVLAGDMVRAAADTGVEMVAVTLLYRLGYFTQRLAPDGAQQELDAKWPVAAIFEAEQARITITMEDREVLVCAWRYDVRGIRGHTVPVYFLDSDLPENAAEDRALSRHLYGGDAEYRLRQEMLLGFGGMAMLKALGHRTVDVFHLNEGHSTLLPVTLLEEQVGSRPLRSATAEDINAVRAKCVFTTHTPVAAGHDKFDVSLVARVIGSERTRDLRSLGAMQDGVLNMTSLGLFFSDHFNGVSLRHEEVVRRMFPSSPVSSVTNGIHAATWVSQPFQEVFDKHIPGWRTDNHYLRRAIHIPLSELRDAHARAKRALVKEVGDKGNVEFDPAVLTIGYARCATSYKRPEMLLSHPERLRKIARDAGPLQVVFAGKAHPNDAAGKELIKRVHQQARSLDGIMKVAYLPDYDMRLAGILCSGVDAWLNTPEKPWEASGTSGMKAAVNGVPSLSVLDGWWVEGCIEGVTGWAIGDSTNDSQTAAELESLYDKLEFTVIPMYYSRPAALLEIARNCIAINGSYFNTQRMLAQYRRIAYRDGRSATGE